MSIFSSNTAGVCSSSSADCLSFGAGSEYINCPSPRSFHDFLLSPHPTLTDSLLQLLLELCQTSNSCLSSHISSNCTSSCTSCLTSTCLIPLPTPQQAMAPLQALMLALTRLSTHRRLIVSRALVTVARSLPSLPASSPSRKPATSRPTSRASFLNRIPISRVLTSTSSPKMMKATSLVTSSSLSYLTAPMLVLTPSMSCSVSSTR